MLFDALLNKNRRSTLDWGDLLSLKDSCVLCYSSEYQYLQASLMFAICRKKSNDCLCNIIPPILVANVGQCPHRCRGDLSQQRCNSTKGH